MTKTQLRNSTTSPASQTPTRWSDRPRQHVGHQDPGAWEIFRHGLSEEREADFQAFIEEGGETLQKFAIWSALVERLGVLILPESTVIPIRGRGSVR